MRMRNFATHPVKAQIGDERIHVAPGDCVELPDAYCMPTRTPGGGRASSTIEDLTAGVLQPDDDAERAVWLRVPELPKPPQPPRRIPSVDSVMVQRGVSRGVAELLVAQAAAEAAGVNLQSALEGELRSMGSEIDKRGEQLMVAQGRVETLEGELRAADARVAQLEAQIEQLTAPAAPAPEPAAPAKKGGRP